MGYAQIQMARLTVYLDEETKRRIQRAARHAEVSVSQWVRREIAAALQPRWPAGYFEVFGSLKGSEMKRPVQLRFGSDARRESL